MICSILIVIALLAPQDSSPFQNLDYQAAADSAKKSKKILVLYFWKADSEDCKAMEPSWKDATLRAWMAEKAVALKLEGAKVPALLKKFEIRAFPTTLFLNADGSEIDRSVIPYNPEAIVRLAEKGIAGKSSLAMAKQNAADHPGDPTPRQRFGDELARRGRWEEALVEYLWCFDHGLEQGKGYYGVRLSFLLGSIVDLGKDLPSAIVALKDRRDAAEKAILANGASAADAAADFSSINKRLKDDARTLALFDKLGPGVPAIRRMMFDEVIDLLLDAKRYTDVLDGAGGDPVKNLESAIDDFARYESQLGDQKSTIDHMKKGVARDHGKFYEALLGTKQVEVAAKLSARLIEFDPSGATFAELIKRAQRAGDLKTAKALTEQGLSIVPEGERDLVKKAAEGLPAAK